MTPTEKLAKIKDILFRVEGDIDYDAGGNLEGVIQDLKHHPEYKNLNDPVVLSTIKRVQKQIYDVWDVLNEPEVNLGDRFPHITHHEEHQHDDSDGW